MPNNPFWNAFCTSSQATADRAAHCAYNFWQMPAAYWQTVSTIMGQRSSTALTLQQCWQDCCTQLAQCRTPAEVAQCLNTYQQRCTLHLTGLNLSTHQHRAELWRQWQILTSRCVNPQQQSAASQACPTKASMPCPSVSLPSSSSSAPALKPVAPSTQTHSSAPVPTAAPRYLKGWFVAAPVTTPKARTAPQSSLPLPTPLASTSETKQEPKAEAKPEPKPEPKPAVSLPKPVIVASTTPASEPAAYTPKPQPLPVAVGQSHVAEPELAPESTSGNQISSTADSVMRTSSGATMAAAAATRRSVLARHSTRKGRMGRGR